MTVITKNIKRNFYDIPDSYRQIFGHPNFSLMRSSQLEVVRERTDGEISDETVKIVKFLKEATFATADQISEVVGHKVSDKELDKLFRNLFINKFVLSDLEDPDAINEKDALFIYTLDFGGDYLLSYEGVDMTNWKYADVLASAQLVAKGLMQAQILVGLLKANNLTIRDYQQFREYRVGKELVRADFSTSLQPKSDPDLALNFIGYMVTPGFEDIVFREQADILNSVFNRTKSWMRYYPLGGTTLPRLLLIVRNTADLSNVQRLAKVLANATDYEGKMVWIMGYQEIADEGLGNAPIFTFVKQEDGDPKVGHINTDFFK